MNRTIGGLLLSALLAGCSTTQVTPTANSVPGSRTGAVDVLYSTPSRPYRSIGIVSAKRYKPGWTDPTTSDAVPQLRAAGAQLGADAVIVRGSRSNNDRHVVVEGEAIVYTDISGADSGEAVRIGALAQGFSIGRGCGNVSLISASEGRYVYQAVCPAGRTLIVECKGTTCNAIN